MPAPGRTWAWKSTRPGSTSWPEASSVWVPRVGGISGSIAAIMALRMPMSRLPRRFWLGSTTSPPRMIRS